MICLTCTLADDDQGHSRQLRCNARGTKNTARFFGLQRYGLTDHGARRLSSASAVMIGIEAKAFTIHNTVDYRSGKHQILPGAAEREVLCAHCILRCPAAPEKEIGTVINIDRNRRSPPTERGQ